jgi:hypothetical protein
LGSATIFCPVKELYAPLAYEERKVKTLFSCQPKFFFEGHPIVCSDVTRSGRASSSFRAEHQATKEINSGDVL